MKRWYWKRWIYSVVFGTTATVGLALAQQGGTEAPPGPPKVGDVMTLKMHDGTDRQVKVIKTEKQPDGSYLSEIKDVKTGEMLPPLLDRPSDTPPTGKTAPKQTDTPKAKPRTSDPLVPSLKDSMPDASKDKKPSSDERRGFGIFSKPPAAAAAAPMPPTMPETEQPNRRFIDRLLGRGKDPTPPAKPATPTTTTTAKPATPSPSTAMPPAIRPTPSASAPSAGPTTEPHILPTIPSAPPVAVPTPVIPLPPSPPAVMPPVIIPAPAATVPSTLPAIPSVPPVGVPAPGALPVIPPAPQNQSMSQPLIVPAGHIESTSPAMTAMMRDIGPYIAMLESESNPSQRVLAVRSLAGCRHASTDMVKMVLFHTAQTDASPMVRACCVKELCNLGYYDPAFVFFLRTACYDPSAEMCATAKDALARMTMRK